MIRKIARKYEKLIRKHRNKLNRNRTTNNMETREIEKRETINHEVKWGNTTKRW